MNAEDQAVLRDEREERAGRSFDDSVALFVNLCQTKVEAYYKKNSRVPWTILLWDTGGKTMVWVWIERKYGLTNDRHVYAFVERCTGDIYWAGPDSMPTKEVRSNVFDSDPSTFDVRTHILGQGFSF